MSAERWVACEYPERPLDLDVVFHDTNRRYPPFCLGCVVAVEAAVQRSGSVADDMVFGRAAIPHAAALVIEAYRAGVGP